MRAVCLIPARSGSKGLKNKKENIGRTVQTLL